MTHYFITPFAISGDQTAIPDPVQPGGEVSNTQGFGPDYSLPNSDPSALKVPRDQTNWLYYVITSAIQQYQQYGTPEWITSADNGGTPFAYAAGARVKYTDGAVWVSLVNANTSEPSTDATKWLPAATIQQLTGNYAGIVPVTTTPYTMLAANKGKLHIFSGSALVATMPAIAGATDADAFPMVNVGSSLITVNRDGSSTFANVSGSTTAFVLPPFAGATPTKSAAAVWTVVDLLSNNSISRKSYPVAQTVTDFTAITYTFAHTLAAVPDIVTVKLTCLVADAGYSPGDVVIVDSFAVSNEGMTVEVTSSNVVVRFPSGGFSLANKGGGGTTALSAASRWSMSVVAMS